MAKLVFECLDDFQHLLGGDFRKMVLQITQNSLIPESFTRLGKKIFKIKKNYNSTLSGKRNNYSTQRSRGRKAARIDS